VLLATKSGMRRTGSSKMGWAPAHFADDDALRRAVEASRAALQPPPPPPPPPPPRSSSLPPPPPPPPPPPIALWQMHHCDGYETAPGLDAGFRAAVRGALALQRSGAVARVGLCNCSATHVEIALAEGLRVASVQNRYSLWDRAAEAPRSLSSRFVKGNKSGVLRLCEERGIAFLAYGALGGVGARDGRLSLEGDFPALARLARAKGATAHALVLAWMRHKWPACLVHIVGARTAEHVRDSLLSAPAVRFTQAEFELIDALRPPPGKRA